MSVMKGLAQGLMGAGQAVSQGLYAYSQMLKDDERERMREASMERRWAREDAIRANAEAKADTRYEEEKTYRKEERDYRREQDTKAEKRYENESARRDTRESRMEAKQDVALLNQSLTRLKEDRDEKAEVIKERFIDPMTKQILDQDGYQEAMAALNSAYQSDTQSIIQHSGLSAEQMDKYGYSTLLGSPGATKAPTSTEKSATEKSATEKSATENGSPTLSPTGETTKPAFDRAAWAGGLNPAEELTAEQFKLLTPQEQRKRLEQRQQLRQSGGLMTKPATGDSVFDKLGRVL